LRGFQQELKILACLLKFSSREKVLAMGHFGPNIATDKAGKGSFEYFNARTRVTYKVVIEGIDANGNLGRQV